MIVGQLPSGGGEERELPYRVGRDALPSSGMWRLRGETNYQYSQWKTNAWISIDDKIIYDRKTQLYASIDFTRLRYYFMLWLKTSFRPSLDG